MKIERLIRDQRVAVLYSPGFGAGWSTWCHDFESDATAQCMMFDPQIADIVDRGDEDWQQQVEMVARVKYPDQCLLGLEDLRVAWLPQGTRFRLVEYDGSESIEILEKIDWIVA